MSEQKDLPYLPKDMQQMILGLTHCVDLDPEHFHKHIYLKLRKDLYIHTSSSEKEVYNILRNEYADMLRKIEDDFSTAQKSKYDVRTSMNDMLRVLEEEDNTTSTVLHKKTSFRPSQYYSDIVSESVYGAVEEYTKHLLTDDDYSVTKIKKFKIITPNSDNEDQGWELRHLYLDSIKLLFAKCKVMKEKYHGYKREPQLPLNSNVKFTVNSNYDSSSKWSVGKHRFLFKIRRTREKITLWLNCDSCGWEGEEDAVIKVFGGVRMKNMSIGINGDMKSFGPTVFRSDYGVRIGEYTNSEILRFVNRKYQFEVTILFEGVMGFILL